MLKLKKYQEKTLEVLQRYLEQGRFKGAKQAYDDVQYERYNSTQFKPFQPLSGLEEIPYACLRLPTGGGKTLLSAHTISLAGKAYIESDYPLALWLVPTTTIKEQTLETLKNPDHPNRQVLEQAFDGRFRVFDISDFRQIRPQDMTDAACIVVSTFAALRVDNTEGRKVYEYDENLESHFNKIPSYTEGMERDEASGKIKLSFANLLHWHRPLVIVDEAHNAKSELSVEVLRRVNAACVIEYTATPAKNSNVIHSVSAAELKAEQMIKLPIILYADHVSWEQAIIGSIQTRQKLEELAAKDKDYIRPIILFQAENKDKTITVEAIEKYLVENEGIPRTQIAIATGDQRELDSLNLFDANCPIRYVITVQALKEGWDCSFAYVLCSVANTKSVTAVEQLLGRVLRMPYAQTRAQEELNKAYAHVSSQSWPHAVSQLHERLVSMGFEKQEAEEFLYTQPASPTSQKSNFVTTLTAEPDLSVLTETERRSVKVDKTPLGFLTLTVQGDFDEALVEKLVKAVPNKQDKAEIALRGKLHIQQKKERQTPSQKGEPFTVPQLCLSFEYGVELAERELFLDENGWDLLAYPTSLDKNTFSVNEQAKQYAADISGEKIVIQQLNQTDQLQLDGIQTDMSELDLCRWLDKKLRQPDVKQEILLEFLRRTVRDLLARTDMDMGKLIRGKFILEKVLRERIERFRQQAYDKGYQACLFGSNAIVTAKPEEFSFRFDPTDYPANLLYDGPIAFQKHYYPRIGIMNGEEAECAQAIDRNPLVKFWVRNLERQPRHAFWLPTSTDKFYPDFIALLNDGRLLVIEYKGGHLKGDDAEEKELLGKVWAEKTGHLFLMGWKKDNQGYDIYQQINKVLEEHNAVV